LLEAVRDLPKLMHYLHVPLQSGCDDVLRLMKRGYTVDQYREMLHLIREIIPQCAVSSDFIVGHPGESEESFEKSMELVTECRFKNSFIFKYSPRPGTRADELYEDDVPEEAKRRRNNEMLALQNEISEEDNAEFIGTDVEILVEGPSKTAQKEKERNESSQPTQLMGRTRCDRIVVFDGNPRLIGTQASIGIDDCTATTLIGHVVTREIQHGSSELLPIVS